MKNLLVIFLLYTASSYTQAQENYYLTKYELSNYLETPSYQETVDYCKLLDAASPYVKYTSFGKSAQGNDLPVLIVDKDSNFSAEGIRKKGKLVLMIQACIHPGEPDGKDAGFLFIRDLVIYKKNIELLDKMSIIFVPIINVDGHERFGAFNRINQNGPKEMGWRTTANNLNMNRDFVKAETVEMKALLQLYNKWLPEFMIDCHTTDGADYQYTITYELVIYGNMDKAITEWTRDNYLKNIERTMNEAGYLITPYVAFRNWHDPRSGLRSWACEPMLSEGYAAMQNRPALLIETHMLKDYKTRVTATYEMILQTAKHLYQEGKSLQYSITQADMYAASPEFRKIPFALDYTSTSDSIMVDFKGVEYDAVKSDLTGGIWFQYHTDKPTIFKVPFFNQQKPTVTANLPEAYVIPSEWSEIGKLLDLHGIYYNRILRPINMEVTQYRLSNPKWSERPYEGHITTNSFDVEEIKGNKTIPAGSLLVNMNQRTARMIAHILEPQAPGSLVFWGYFNSIFEQKEYAESYVMESLARKMMAEDPSLKDAFEKKKKEDKEFAKNPQAMLNWFYMKTPYWDVNLGLYPIFKITNPGTITLIYKLNGLD